MTKETKRPGKVDICRSCLIVCVGKGEHPQKYPSDSLIFGLLNKKMECRKSYKELQETQPF